MVLLSLSLLHLPSCACLFCFLLFVSLTAFNLSLFSLFFLSQSLSLSNLLSLHLFCHSIYFSFSSTLLPLGHSLSFLFPCLPLHTCFSFLLSLLYVFPSFSSLSRLFTLTFSSHCLFLFLPSIILPFLHCLFLSLCFYLTTFQCSFLFVASRRIFSFFRFLFSPPLSLTCTLFDSLSSFYCLLHSPTSSLSLLLTLALSSPFYPLLSLSFPPLSHYLSLLLSLSPPFPKSVPCVHHSRRSLFSHALFCLTLSLPPSHTLTTLIHLYYICNYYKAVTSAALRCICCVKLIQSVRHPLICFTNNDTIVF